MNTLLHEIRQCKLCKDELSHDPRPVLAAHTRSKLVIIGQAPGAVVHRTGVPWDDKSGENLRAWLGVSQSTFYDPEKIALVPMGFCYPGKGKSGDLPPMPTCAPTWHSRVLGEMKEVKLTLLIGQYAQGYYLGGQAYNTLTETVRHFEDYLPKYFVLPHPSPRNNIWRAKNPWFDQEVLPSLQHKISECL
ncbi:uracil-DNA glycosylase family protein [Reichenbachiella carrageenanivorans]|uniref:Uracil-DNA glycosylase family protein n=1 Tax=Reichenbachiella carrageenanivorans TaxID=2979869 RepID=A0ABY6CZC5_9BACT|nr:uracil-DNA glycosylase family protein [Reichenbachiella carrageenanivorans]UXX79059.1 uracil-DNA glycosylase family protein [Reichenbachiella carrageenanivorans]